MFLFCNKPRLGQELTGTDGAREHGGFGTERAALAESSSTGGVHAESGWWARGEDALNVVTEPTTQLQVLVLPLAPMLVSVDE